VSELEAAGAARLEKRNGYPYNYTVLIVNDDHPDVLTVHETMETNSASTKRHSASDTPAEADAPLEDDSDEVQGSSSHDEYGMDEAIESPTAPTSTVSTENGDDAPLDETEDEQY
jgi:hypothetical protein